MVARRTLDHMAGHDLTWTLVCLALATAWTVAVSWRAETGTLSAAARGVLGGLAALGTASVAYGLIQIVGVEIRWERVASGAWPALGFAAVIGLVEEGAKLTGIVLAVPSRGKRNVVQTTAAVAAVFAIAEAAVALRDASWSVALSRAALGPVAHAVLAAPMAVALVEVHPSRRSQRALRLLIAVGFAAALHGLGDWSVAHPRWGRLGFAAAMSAPALWLYVRARVATARVRVEAGAVRKVA